MLSVEDVERHLLSFSDEISRQNYIKTALECVCWREGRLDLMKMLKKYSTYFLNYLNSYLVCACVGGHIDIVVSLIEEDGANVRFQDDNPVKSASLNGHLSVVKYLYKMGANIRIDNDYCVRFATWYNYIDLVKYLVSIGADIRTDNDFCLQKASERGYIELVKYLTKLGADIQVQDNYSVKRAAANGHLEIVLFFYENNVDIRVMGTEMFHRLEICDVEFCKKYITLYEKMKNKKREKAQKKIYFWWIPICYDIYRDCGQRMMQKNWEKTYELLVSF